MGHHSSIMTKSPPPPFFFFAVPCLLYLYFQISYSMLFYTFFLFWATVFPFHYRKAKSNGRVKRVFIAALVTIFVVPLMPLILLKEGYFSSFYLLNACVPRGRSYFYAIETLHLSLLIWITSSLLVIIMWKIFKVRTCILHV
jgi:hypothetical protein